MDSILRINNLSKSFGEVKAVNNISFEVKRGSLFAFLGQNGAGKSVTIKMITTLLSKDSGEIYFNEQADTKYFREKIGVVFQENVLDYMLTVKENLLLRGSFYLKNKVDVERRYTELVDKLNLNDLENKPFKDLSGGQKRRVEIARALFSNPELLILDEPTTGLDPEARQVVWKVIEKLRKEEGITVLLTTHYLEEANDADYVVVIHKGNVVAEGTPSEIISKHSRDLLKVVPIDKNILIDFLNERNLVFKKVSDVYQIEIKDSFEAIEIIKSIESNIKNFEVINGNLNDSFVKIVGEQNVWVNWLSKEKP